jgi:iron(III) transport system substrate-binding protein
MLQNYSDPAVLAQPDSVKPDLIIAKDLVFLTQIKNLGLTQAMDQLPIFSDIKPGMMDSKDLHWVGITYQARTLAYGVNVDVSSINSYEDLAKPEWAGRLCVRTSNNSYNYGLVSFLIAEYGYEDAKDILLGWMDNLAMPVFKGDTLILNAINSGECEVGIVNHYYLAREYDKAQGQGTKYNVNIKYLNQGQGGVHTNGYGVALLKTSKEKALAQQFVEMLLSEKAQLEISTSQFAYPVVQNIDAQSLIQAWGEFETSPLVWSELGENLDLAEQLMQEVDYK